MNSCNEYFSAYQVLVKQILRSPWTVAEFLDLVNK